MALAPELRAICAAPTVSGSRPNSLVSTTRTEGPPMEIWTISRRVVPSVPGAPNLALGFLAAMGDAAQVPTQWSEGVAAVTEIGLKQQRASRGSRREDLLELMVMGAFFAIGRRTILPLFRGDAVIHV
jgi:hypothetical protein